MSWAASRTEQIDSVAEHIIRLSLVTVGLGGDGMIGVMKAVTAGAVTAELLSPIASSVGWLVAA
jgi:hypothetical protein